MYKAWCVCPEGRNLFVDRLTAGRVACIPPQCGYCRRLWLCLWWAFMHGSSWSSLVYQSMHQIEPEAVQSTLMIVWHLPLLLIANPHEKVAFPILPWLQYMASVNTLFFPERKDFLKRLPQTSVCCRLYVSQWFAAWSNELITAIV